MKYLKLTMFTFLLITFTASGTMYAGEFVFSVRHDHLLGGGKGKLVIGADGIEFQAEKAKDSRRWPYRDIKGIDIVSPQKLIVQTYEDRTWRLGADREFSFEIVAGEITGEVYKFLLEKIDRPITTRVLFPSNGFVYQLPVKHRHRLGGCQGVLKIAEDRIIYDTERSEDRRIWFYKDIESVGSSDLFHLRITSFTETFTFDLKERINEKAYDYIWERVNRVRIEPQRRGGLEVEKGVLVRGDASVAPPVETYRVVLVSERLTDPPIPARRTTAVHEVQSSGLCAWPIVPAHRPTGAPPRSTKRVRPGKPRRPGPRSHYESINKGDERGNISYRRKG